ncbi:MAG: aspartate kinase [Bacteroidota bacterium]
MKVFKFGGASVKSAEGIINLSTIVSQKMRGGDIVVVSAMGKTTARLEEMAFTALSGNHQYVAYLESIRIYHQEIVTALFDGIDQQQTVARQVEELFEQLSIVLKREQEMQSRAFLDTVLAFGEILSTTIVAAYLQHQRVPVQWKDIRKYIRTDRQFGGARVDWLPTMNGLKTGLVSADHIVVTQGYIASTAQGETTTLGKEGSDFTAAIIAKACDAEHVTFWKDVPGVYNADPKKQADATPYGTLSYRQVVEMTYYGAKVIHPKTMRPLAENGIPLHVCSFLEPDLPGTRISATAGESSSSQLIFKHNQVLVSFKIINLEFIGEQNIGLIFYTFDRLGIQTNIIQSSATSCTFAFDFDEERLEQLLDALADKFSMYFNKGLTLATFRNVPEEIILTYLEGAEVYLRQSSRTKVRILYKA